MSKNSTHTAPPSRDQSNDSISSHQPKELLPIIYINHRFQQHFSICTIIRKLRIINPSRRRTVIARSRRRHAAKKMNRV